jgi:enoyl-CoA hydratase
VSSTGTGLTADWPADRVVTTLDRPERRNALNRDLIAGLPALLDRLDDEPRLLILTGGTDGTFASGADSGELLEPDRSDALAAINLVAFERLRATPMPTIAAIDGHPLGGGAELAYACDLRVASTRARFGQPEAQLGIMAAAGGCYRLPALVGEAVAQGGAPRGTRTGSNGRAAVRARVAGGRAGRAARRRLRARGPRPEGCSAGSAPDQAVHQRAGRRAPDLERAAQAILFDSDEKRERMRAFLDRHR